MKVLFPGSFDPIHIGHIKIIEKILQKYQVVYILVAINPLKNHYFDLNTRYKMVKKTFQNNERVKVFKLEENDLTILFANRHNINHIIRGKKDANKKYEILMRNEYLKLNSNLTFENMETNLKTSSLQIQNLLLNGNDISNLVPNDIIVLIKNYEKR